MKIFKKIKKLFQESLLRARIANSQDLEYDNKISEAINLLNIYENIAHNDKRNRVEFFLIRSRLKHKLHHFQDALDDAYIAKSYIEKIHDENEEYLKKYLYFLLKNIYLSQNNEKWKFYENLYNSIDSSSIKIDELLEQWLPLPKS